ncbi:unnamed protein product [Phytophthora lilii]|uniref:Unnamed protein product n=1 Tax=Phytophthora lilii TaxID=2077276 RepID=A0A9W6TMG0_9STRA|nr:unnamed protein product [Phytophthora lilii]
MIGPVYKITNDNKSIVYIGSTTESIRRRFQRHKYDYQQWINGTLDRCHSIIHYSFRDHGINSFKISLISEHEIDNPRQLHEFEQLVIDQTPCVNKYAAYRTDEQHQKMVRQRYQRNRGERLEKARQYAETNKRRSKPV